jgi:hypothetical protein
MPASPLPPGFSPHRAPQDDRRDGHATSIVAEVERLHWRIWNGKAKNAQRSIEPIW